MGLQCSQGNALCFRNISLSDLLAVFGDTSHLLLHFQHFQVESTSLPGKDRVQKAPAPSARALCLSLSSLQRLLLQVWIPNILPGCTGAFLAPPLRIKGICLCNFHVALCVFTQHGAGMCSQLLETSPETTACEGGVLEAAI